jgi:hypothetical protein
VKLQQRYKTLERNFNLLNSTTKLDQDSFICRLLKIVADLFNRELYRFDELNSGVDVDFHWLVRALRCSDIPIKLDGETLYGHRFILAARSLKWDPQLLGDAADLDLSGRGA